MPTKTATIKEGWQKLKLGEVVSIIDGDRGKNYPHQYEFQDSGFCLFLNTKNVPSNYFSFEQKMFITEEKDNLLRKGKLQRYDYVLTTRGTLGNFAFYSDKVPYENVRLNSGMVVMRVDKNSPTDMSYFKCYLDSSSFKDQVRERATGSAQPQLPIKDLSTFEIDLPPLETQKKIADVLGAYDDLIEVNQKKIKILENMAQTIYKEWFVKPVKNGLPDGWEVKKLEDLVSTQYGYTESANTEKIGPKYLRGMDINKKTYIDWNDVPYCKIEDELFEKYRVKKNDIFIIRMADPGKIGICEIDVSAVFASYLIRLEINEKLTPYYLFYFLISDTYQNYIKGASGGTTRQSASAGVVVGIDILIPEKSLMAKFENRVSEIRTLMNNLIIINSNLQKTRDLLIPQLVGGRISLK